MLDIVLPCYNSDPALLEAACDSIALQETEYEYCVLMMDDGTKDDRVKDIWWRQPWRWGYTRLPHLGLPTALRKGHEMARSKYICWTSDDNLLDPDFVQSMVSKAEEGFDFVRCKERHIDRAGNFLYESDPRHGNSALPVAGLYDGYLGAGHIYSRELYERTAGYDPAMAGIEDLDMYYQLMKRHPRVGFVDRPLYVYRDGTSRFSEARVQEARRKLMTKWGLK